MSCRVVSRRVGSCRVVSCRVGSGRVCVHMTAIYVRLAIWDSPRCQPELDPTVHTRYRSSVWTRIMSQLHRADHRSGTRKWCRTLNLCVRVCVCVCEYAYVSVGGYVCVGVEYYLQGLAVGILFHRVHVTLVYTVKPPIPTTSTDRPFPISNRFSQNQNKSIISFQYFGKFDKSTNSLNGHTWMVDLERFYCTNNNTNKRT